VQRLAAWGAAPSPAGLAPRDGDVVTPPSLSLAAYEAGRPSAAAACRIGDARLLAGARVD
jgi:hydrogenase maturation protease